MIVYRCTLPRAWRCPWNNKYSAGNRVVVVLEPIPSYFLLALVLYDWCFAKLGLNPHRRLRFQQCHHAPPKSSRLLFLVVLVDNALGESSSCIRLPCHASLCGSCGGYSSFFSFGTATTHGNVLVCVVHVGWIDLQRCGCGGKGNQTTKCAGNEE